VTQTATNTRAVGYTDNGPVDSPDALIDVEIDVPPPGSHDLLVEVKAVSVNPVDVKVRASVDPGGVPKVLGWDAAGVVVGVGSDVSLFKVGDAVYYAGSIDRPGSNADRQLVDERIVGHKPGSLSFAEAAALPLTTITAWETLFDRLGLTADSDGTLLVMAAAGGVGSMVVQLARQLTNVTVIGTASRPESTDWATKMGARHVINHHNLIDEAAAAASDGLDYIFTPYSTDNVEAFAQLLKPRGAVVAIDDPHQLDLLPLKSKSLSWHWELMFTRPLHEPESTYQHELLEKVSALIDTGALSTTVNVTLDGLTAATLIEAHRQSESSAAIGKIVIVNTPH
jgi:zinc-binding alcohol dehydrogenase family protein